MSDTAGSGFAVLDGVALVAGAAVASVHMRGVLDENLHGAGWLLILIPFAWLGLTAAGPFVYLVRRYARPAPGVPKVGDRLWALLGLPWLLTALIQANPSQAGGVAPPVTPGSASATILFVGLGVVSLIAQAVVWATWVAVTPERATATFSTPWTNRVGLVLAVTWPLQYGLGLVVTG